MSTAHNVLSHDGETDADAAVLLLGTANESGRVVRVLLADLRPQSFQMKCVDLGSLGSTCTRFERGVRDGSGHYSYLCCNCQTLYSAAAMRALPGPITVEDVLPLSAPGSYWYVICSEIAQGVRRYRVPDGWLYQIEYRQETVAFDDSTSTVHTGWHPPVFVADPAIALEDERNRRSK